MKFSDSVRFLPWVGSNYGSKSRWGTRVLMVGESHYTSNGNAKPRDFTQHCVETHASGKWKSKSTFWTRAKRVLVEKGAVSHREFWDSVAFYNYVQELVGEGPRKRPTERMWEISKAPFEEVVEALNPGCIVVLGKGLWKHLPSPDSSEQTISEGDYAIPTRRYGTSLAGRTSHPASFGFSSRRWRPSVLNLISKSKEA